MQISSQFPPDPGSPLRVFIVEDSKPVLERLEEMVANVVGACCTGSAATADAALRGIVETAPDAVILDVGLAQGSGFDVLRALKEKSLQIHVYVLSNFAAEPYRRMAERLGAAAFFDKCSQMDDMRTLLAQRAARHAARRH